MSDNSNPSRKDNVFALELVDAPQNQRVASSTLLVDLRKSPRFDASSPAELLTEDGRKFPCIMTNISRTGLQLECDSSIRSILQTGILGFIRHKTPTMCISFSLPDNVSHNNPVRALCKTVYTCKVRQGTTLVGVKFLSFKEGEDILAEYLSFRELTD